MDRRLAASMVALVLSGGLAGCGGCDCNEGGLSDKEVGVTQVCTAVADLTARLAPVSAINSSTSVDQVKNLRVEIDRGVVPVLANRGRFKEDLRTELQTAREDFDAAVDTFGAPFIGPAAAATLNPPYQAVRGNLRAIDEDLRCSR